MASLSTSRNGRRSIQFPMNGKRATLRLGTVDRKTAEAIRTHVERLIFARELGQPAPDETARWLAGIGDGLHDRLATLGLVERRSLPASRQLTTFLDGYIAGRTDLKERSTSNLIQVRNGLVEHFGATRDLATINRGTAADWHRWLKSQKYAGPTIAMHVKKARQFFADAIDRGLVTSNPFAKLKAGSQVNAARIRYVPAADIHAVMNACPDDEWRLIFALARFAGLRHPSETKLLTWRDIDWARNRMIVTSPKTAHHPGKDSRVIPIFPGLYPYLRAAFEAAGPGATHVIATHRGANTRTRALKIVRRAKLQQWPRLFQNLRASCETDLATQHALHVVVAWIGNTEAVAIRHYLTVTESDFERATAGNGSGDANGGASSATVGVGIPEQMPSTETPKPLNFQGFGDGQLPPRGVSSFTPFSGIPKESIQAAHRAMQNALHGPLARRYSWFRGRMLMRTARQPFPGPRQRAVSRQVARMLTAATAERGRA